MSRKPKTFEFNGNDFECVDTPVKALSKSQLKTMTLLDRLEHLIDISECCGLSKEFFKLHADLIQSVADNLTLTPEQTVLLCPYVANPCSNLDHSDLRGYFKCSSITIMRHKSDLAALIHRRYLAACGGFRHGREGNLRLSEKAEKALCDNHGLPVVKTTGLTANEFMGMFRSLINENQRLHIIDNEELVLETMELMVENPQLEIVKAINNLMVSDNDKYIILYFCKSLVVDGEEGIPLSQFDDDFDDIFDFSERVLSGHHLFVKEGLLEPLRHDNLFNRDIYGLTEKARKLFLGEYIVPKREKTVEMSNSNVIHSKNIKPKPMYYCDEDEGQINTLFGLLEDKQLKTIRNRLEKANLRKGFNCLFYGAPGTGKTETALQLARATGRDIMQVDISSIRDKWYGETEKIVKSIFEDYARLVKRAPKIPILLINEADALLSVRTGIGNNPSIDKTENAIQNILLEAMENIDGIMIATTNLTCNLDSAFDRRFLYKVEFHQPSIEAKTNIWKTFLPDLKVNEAKELARSFDFSGGQIENIARKAMVDHLLFGNKPDLNRVMELCSQEKISGRTNDRKPIGFH